MLTHTTEAEIATKIELLKTSKRHRSLEIMRLKVWLDYLQDCCKPVKDSYIDPDLTSSWLVELRIISAHFTSNDWPEFKTLAEAVERMECQTLAARLAMKMTLNFDSTTNH
jgi:hypothetical protein